MKQYFKLEQATELSSINHLNKESEWHGSKPARISYVHTAGECDPNLILLPMTQSAIFL